MNTASKHEAWVFNLLIQATENNLLPEDSIFVDMRLHRLDVSYQCLVNGHVTYVSQLRVITIVGLTAEVVEHTRVDKTNT